MSFPIAQLRDDFTDNVIGELWLNAFVPSGSATRAETGGQARFTLPSSTAGIHQAGYQSSATYDLTGDGVSINVDTMVSTSVSATAALTLFDNADVTTWVRIAQLSGTLYFQKNLAAGTTTLASVSYSSSTHKYWRIRESAGTIFFDTSSNGTSWTNRASVTTALSIPVTAVIVRIDATCGNVASPGSFRVEEMNAIYPAPSSTWRETTADWSITNRLRPITLASDGGKQGVIVTADTMDSSRTLGGTVRYFAGPLGSSSGGYLALTEYASLVLAQASPFAIPVDGRVDLPAMVDARYVRLYHRSIDASAHTIYEFVPRRIVQADDIEAESIRAINIAAGAITADKIFVLTLGAITANIGKLNIDTTGWLYQGTGSGDSPTTGLKIFNSGGIGKLSTYNATVEQVTLDTDGKLKAGAGVVQLDSGGLKVIVPTDDNYLANGSLKFQSSGGTVYADIYALDFLSSPFDNQLRLNSNAIAGQPSGVYALAAAPTTYEATVQLAANSGGSSTTIFRVIADDNARNYATLSRDLDLALGLNVGTATGAGTGQISTSGSVGIGVAVQTVARLKIQSGGTTNATSIISGYNATPTLTFYVLSDATGFLNNTAWTYSSDATKKRNIRNLNKDIVDFMRLDGKLFDYIDGPSDRYGYLAQDVQAVIPSIVETLPDGSLGMRTDEINIIAHAVLRRLIRILVQKNVIGPADIA